MSPELLKPVAATSGGCARAPLLGQDLDQVVVALSDHGAAMLRGLDLTDVAAQLDAIVRQITGLSPLPYWEQSSPRTHLGNCVFSATDYPSHASLFLHNELSYANSWPSFVFFYCERPADEGGETLLADCHRVLEEIPRQIVAEFEEKAWTYVRNLRGAAGLDWSTTFQTTSREEVAKYCRENDIQLEWLADGARIGAVRPAIAVHPENGQRVWFNHVAAFHLSTLPDDVRIALTRLFPRDRLPVNTYYGDGGSIDDAVVEEVRAAYRRASVSVAWKRGDLLVIDNNRVAHGRARFRGARRIMVALAGRTVRSNAPCPP
jgi:alpha-ketoglutarate-dependent taurine dioxygenase